MNNKNQAPALLVRLDYAVAQLRALWEEYAAALEAVKDRLEVDMLLLTAMTQERDEWRERALRAERDATRWGYVVTHAKVWVEEFLWVVAGYRDDEELTETVDRGLEQEATNAP